MVDNLRCGTIPGPDTGSLHCVVWRGVCNGKISCSPPDLSFLQKHRIPKKKMSMSGNGTKVGGHTQQVTPRRVSVAYLDWRLYAAVVAWRGVIDCILILRTLTVEPGLELATEQVCT